MSTATVVFLLVNQNMPGSALWHYSLETNTWTSPYFARLSGFRVRMRAYGLWILLPRFIGTLQKNIEWIIFPKWLLNEGLCALRMAQWKAKWAGDVYIFPSARNTSSPTDSLYTFLHPWNVWKAPSHVIHKWCTPIYWHRMAQSTTLLAYRVDILTAEFQNDVWLF